MTDESTTAGLARARSNGPLVILLGTAIGGGSGYVLTILAGARLGAEGYAPFAIFWSSLYLVIAALTGLQQEISRAAHPRKSAVSRPVARNFALAGAITMAVVTLATAPLWQSVVFPSNGWSLVLPLAFGFASYVVTAVTAGVLYGISLWPLIGGMIAADGILRLVLTGGALLVTDDIAVLAWAVVLPFLLAPLALWVFLRSRLVGRFELDVGYRSLTGNMLRTLPGSLATGVLISGFPALLGATSQHVPAAELAALAFSINLARAPLVIVVLSLQSYFLVTFQRSASPLRTMALLLLATAGGAVVLAAAAAWLGPAILGAVFGPDFVVDGVVLGSVVGSGGLVGMLCITGAAVLAGSRHILYSTGWVVAAATSVVLLLAPLEFSLRAVLALVVGPAVGLLAHLLGVALTRRAIVTPKP